MVKLLLAVLTIKKHVGIKRFGIATLLKFIAYNCPLQFVKLTNFETTGHFE